MTEISPLTFKPSAHKYLVPVDIMLVHSIPWGKSPTLSALSSVQKESFPFHGF